MLNLIVETNSNSYGKPVTLYQNGSVFYGDRLVKQPDNVYLVDLVKEKLGIIPAIYYAHLMYFCYRSKSPTAYNSSYGIAAVKLRASKQSIINAEKSLINEGLITKKSNGDIEPRLDSSFSVLVSGCYNTSSKPAPTNARKPKQCEYDLTLLPAIIKGRESVKARENVYAEAMIIEKITSQHVNGLEDYKYNLETFKALSKLCGVSQPTAKRICLALEKAGRFFRKLDIKTLVLYASAAPMKLIKQSVIKLNHLLKPIANDYFNTHPDDFPDPVQPRVIN